MWESVQGMEKGVIAQSLSMACPFEVQSWRSYVCFKEERTKEYVRI